MTFSERVAAWRDRSPRQAATFIAALLVAILAFDGTRLLASRDEIPHSDWDHALRVGLGVGIVLLALGGALWVLARRYPAARRSIEVLAAISVLVIFGSTHHRTGDDSITEPWEVSWVVAGALLFTALLTYATVHRWTRTPVQPRDEDSAG